MGLAKRWLLNAPFLFFFIRINHWISQLCICSKHGRHRNTGSLRVYENWTITYDFSLHILMHKKLIFLLNSHQMATELANKWTKRWTLSNFIAYNETKYMYEKVRNNLIGCCAIANAYKKKWLKILILFSQNAVQRWCFGRPWQR